MARDRAPAAGHGISPSAARVSPSAPEATADSAAATGLVASPQAPSTAAAVGTEAGGVGVWLLGLLLAAAVGGGGWLALQPEWVRRRVLRSLRAAPGRFIAYIARLRRGHKHGATITTTWSTPTSAWTAAALADRDAHAKAEGTGSRRRTKRHPRSITNATLPAFRIPVDKNPDDTHK